MYEVNGSKTLPLTTKVADLLKQKPKVVNIPNRRGVAKKLAVKEYLGCLVYQVKKGENWNDVKYGDALEATESVNIIAINSTIIVIIPGW